MKTTPGPPGEEKFGKHLKDLLRRTGLSVDEVTPLFGVSRVSIYTWIMEKPVRPELDGTASVGPQQPLIRSRALRVIALLEKVEKSGDLPLVEVEKKDRPAVLEAVFKKHLTPPVKRQARAED